MTYPLSKHLKHPSPPPSVDSLVWSITWCQAFPTLCSARIYSYGPAQGNAVWYWLAFSTIFHDDNPEHDDEEWKHARDPSEMADSKGYGEITPRAVLFLMERINSILQLDNNVIRLDDQSNNSIKSVVMDLGSGNGRVLMAASLAYPFQKAIGIEIVPELHQEALENLKRWNQYQYQILPQQVQQGPGVNVDEEAPQTTMTIMEFICGDFRDSSLEIPSADLIFCHATVFNPSLMAALQQLCDACQPGTIFVMVTKPLQESLNNNIQTLEEWRLRMNWGEATVYIQKKV
jgi:SAM-dependent methyltransferase